MARKNYARHVPKVLSPGTLIFSGCYGITVPRWSGQADRKYPGIEPISDQFWTAARPPIEVDGSDDGYSPLGSSFDEVLAAAVVW